MEASDPRISGHYDDLAEHWSWITDSPTREKLLWPTLSGMLPELDGKRVLDAGCGAGIYTARLLDAGAAVVGVDVSVEMIEEARDRVPAATFHVGDLGEPLTFLAGETFDVVLCQHVFSHLPDLATPLAEFARVLQPRGNLVVSTHNPVWDYLLVREEEYPAVGAQAELESTVETVRDPPKYGETERYDVVWSEDAVANRGTYYRRSLTGILSPMLEAGFDLDEVAEPTPDAAFEREHPDLTAQLREYPPDSLCCRATRVGG